MKKLIHPRGDVLLPQLEIAESFSSRAIGLLGRSSLPEGRGLWIRPGNSIHTFFMKFSIDCIFLNRKMQVEKVVYDVRPGRLILPIWGAHSVIEVASGVGRNMNLSKGDTLHVSN